MFSLLFILTAVDRRARLLKHAFRNDSRHLPERIFSSFIFQQIPDNFFNRLDMAVELKSGSGSVGAGTRMHPKSKAW